MVSFCFFEVPGADEIIKPESRMVVARGYRKEVGEGFVSWVQSLFFSGGEGPGDGYPAVSMYLMPQNCTLKKDEDGKFDIVFYHKRRALQPNVLHARRPQHLGQTRSRGPTNPTAMRCGGTKAHSIYYDEILILWVSVVGSWTLKPVVR